MAWEMFKYKKSDGIGYITFDRMEKFNAANTHVFEELAQIMAEIGKDDEVSVAILTGQGKSFCAGVDGENQTLKADKRKEGNYAD